MPKVDRKSLLKIKNNIVTVLNKIEQSKTKVKYFLEAADGFIKWAKTLE